MQGKMELMERCMAQLKQDLSTQDMLKVLRVLGSTANKLADEIETTEQLKEIDNA